MLSEAYYIHPSTGTILQSIACSALAFHVYEWLEQLPFEKSHYWRKGAPNSRWTYLCSRYGGIICQIVNNIAIYKLRSLSISSHPNQWCHVWHGWISVSSLLTLTCLEITCIQRVIALYGGSELVSWATRMLIALEALATCCILLVTNKEIKMVDACLPRQIPIILCIIPIAQASVQLILWILTMVKRGKNPSQAPIFQQVISDACWTFLAFIVLVPALSVQGILSSMQKITPYFGLTAYPVFVAVVANYNCRMIRRMESFRTTGGEWEESAIVLTSLIDSEGSG